MVLGSSGLEIFTKCPVNAGVCQGSILGPTLFLLYINYLPDEVIYSITIYAFDTTLFYVWSDIWFVETTRHGFWTWIWPTRHSRLGQEVACWFQCLKVLTYCLWFV